MPKLGIKEHKIVKISKKGNFRNFLDQFWDFILKSDPKIDQKISKVPFFANFYNFVFLNAKFWHFLNW